MFKTFIKHVIYEYAINTVFDNVIKNVKRKLPDDLAKFSDIDRLLTKWTPVLDSPVIGRKLNKNERIILVQSLEAQARFNKFHHTGNTKYQQYALPLIAKAFGSDIWVCHDYSPVYHSTINIGSIQDDISSICGIDVEHEVAEMFYLHILNAIDSNHMRGILLDFKSDSELDLYL